MSYLQIQGRKIETIQMNDDDMILIDGLPFDGDIGQAIRYCMRQTWRTPRQELEDFSEIMNERKPINLRENKHD